MSIEEHLMENALVAQEAERKGKKHYFFEYEYNKEMAERAGISLETVWKMATYVTYTWMQMHAWDLEDEKDWRANDGKSE